MITGTLIKNYFHCKRQAWLYSRSINFVNEYTKIGNILEQEMNAKQYLLDNIKMDDIKISRKGIRVIEYKKTSSNIDGTRYQLLYYLYILNKKGIKSKGIIKDIEFGDTYYVELNKENKNALLNILEEINSLISKNIIPDKKPKRIDCKKCSFFDYCWVE